MMGLVKRHIKVFSRDRMAFILSFLSVAILIVMYKVFLGQLQIDEINQAMGTTTANQSVIEMVNYWLVAGVLTITTMTSTLGAYGVMILDKESGRVHDFELTGISQTMLQASYIVAAIIMGSIISFFAFLLGMLLFVGIGAFTSFTVVTLLKIALGIIVSSMLSMLMIYPICKLINTRSAFSTLSTIVGTIIGFISGVYISIGSVSSSLKLVMTYFPLTQMNAFFKQLLMEPALKEVFTNAPKGVEAAYRQNFGVDLMTNGGVMTFSKSLTYLLIFSVVLLVIDIVISRVVSKNEHN